LFAIFGYIVNAAWFIVEIVVLCLAAFFCRKVLWLSTAAPFSYPN